MKLKVSWWLAVTGHKYSLIGHITCSQRAPNLTIAVNSLTEQLVLNDLLMTNCHFQDNTFTMDSISTTGVDYV